MSDGAEAIHDKWLQLGGEGFFGAPTNERPDSFGNGLLQRFSGGGVISWHPGTGAFGVWGLIGEKWEALGRERFGYPITDELTCSDGVGRFNHFRKMYTNDRTESSIYWSPRTGAWSLTGAIRAKWFEMGSEQSRLGYPKSDEEGREVRRVEFERGFIEWTRAQGVRVNGEGWEVPFDHGTRLRPSDR